MSKPDPLEDYPLSYQEFYSEIPGSSDYLNDIDLDVIYDEHDPSTDASFGLSAEQVSQIARDSIGSSRPHEASTPMSAPELFPPESTDAESRG